MKQAFNLTVFIVFLGLLAGCDLFASSKQESKSSPDLRKVATATVEPGLEVRLFAPDTVERGAPFELRFSARNRTNKDLELVVDGCVFEPAILRGRSRVRFKGSNIGCLAGTSTHLIREGKALKATFQMQAVLKGGEPVEPGPYAGRVRLYPWFIRGREVRRRVMLSALEWRFVVPP